MCKKVYLSFSHYYSFSSMMWPITDVLMWAIAANCANLVLIWVLAFRLLFYLNRRNTPVTPAPGLPSVVDIVPDKPAKLTRYYTFTRVNPKSSDYDLLVRTCHRINAYLGYRTLRDADKVRLIGFIVLRGPKTIVDDIEQLFPNFHLMSMVGCFGDNYSDLGDDDTIITANEHPFVSVRKSLFRDDTDSSSRTD